MDVVEVMAMAAMNDWNADLERPGVMDIHTCRLIVRAALTALKQAGYVVTDNVGECICPICGQRHGASVVVGHTF